MDPKTPAGSDQNPPDEGKTKVINYLFKPSGEAVMQGQLVYEKEKEKGLFGRKKAPAEFVPNSHLGGGYYQGPEVEHPEDYIQAPASFRTTVTPGASAQAPIEQDKGKDAPPSYGSFAGYTGGAPSNNRNNNSSSKFSFFDILLFPFKLIGMAAMAVWKILGMIKQLIITIIVLIILAAMAVTLVLLYKPPVFWNPIKTFLNNDVDTTVSLSELTSDQVYTKINKEGPANKEVTLNDLEMTRLMRDYTNLDKKCFVLMGADSMRFFTNIDSEERPLWFIVNTVKNDKNKMVIESAGFGRFDTPQSFTSLLNDTVGLVFQFIEKQVTAANHVALFKDILDVHKLDKNLELTDALLEPGQLVLKFIDHSVDTKPEEGF